MKRKILCLMLTAVMAFGLAITANAKEVTASGTVTYDGGETLKANYSTENLEEQIKDVLPGDELKITIDLVNSGKKSVDWYMSNEILQSFEESSKATNGAYTYTLSYEGKNSRVIYDSDTVGGDANGNTGEGLKQATSSLKNMFFLDTMAAGESGKVILTVALDGETQGNSYENAAARISMSFAVEEEGERTVTQTVQTPAGTNGQNNTAASGNTTGTGSTNQADTVKTGDVSQTPWMVTLAAAGALVVLAGCVSAKRRRAGKGVL